MMEGRDFPTEAGRKRFEFGFDHRPVSNRCQRCSRELPFMSAIHQESVGIFIYDTTLRKHEQLVFDLKLCSPCATWLADRIYAKAHDERVATRRHGYRYRKQVA